MAKCIFGLTVIQLMLMGCKRTPRENAVYFWKSSFALSSEEKGVTSENDISVLYLHLFDVVYDEQLKEAKPVAVVNIKDSLTYIIVPVIYIGNEVFTKTQGTDVPALASNVLKLIHSVCNKSHINYGELQFDCDWTESTREMYFGFLNEIRSKVEVKKERVVISATIRLHQVKYREKTGVPPIDKAVIMLYNMGELNSTDESNSILNIEKAKLYITHLKSYPVPYKLALPMFSWSLVFRNGKVRFLNKEICPDDLNDTVRFRLTEPNHFRSKSDFFLHGDYIMSGDIVRYEEAKYEEVKKMLNLAKEYSTDANSNIILYHLDEKVIQRFGKENIRSLFTD
jgi:hypothetical protein